jgi:arginase
MRRIYHFIGACSCWGAQIRTCERGPEELAENHVFEKLEKAGVQISEIQMLYPKQMAFETEIPLSESLPLIHEFNLQLAEATCKAVENAEFPFVVAGDHSSAVGTWNGVRKALQKKSDLPMGLLWIDAHTDAHTLETTPSGAWHGMPVAALMGFGASKLSELLSSQPVIQPEHIAIIGARSYEEAELLFLNKLHVKVYFMEEVEERGFLQVLQEAVEKVSRETVGFGVSIDMDVIDPKDAPGVGSPEKNGISAKEFLQALPFLKNHPKAVGFELVEYNPERDREHKTRDLVYEILKGLTAG